MISLWAMVNGSNFSLKDEYVGAVLTFVNKLPSRVTNFYYITRFLKLNT